MRAKYKSQQTASILLGIRDPNSPKGGKAGSEAARIQQLLEPTVLPEMMPVVVDMPDSKQMVEEAMMMEDG